MFSDSETDSDLGIVPLARKQVNKVIDIKKDKDKMGNKVNKVNKVKKKVKRKKRMTEVELLNNRKWE